MFEFEGFCTLYSDCAYISAHENNSVICKLLKTVLHSDLNQICFNILRYIYHQHAIIVFCVDHLTSPPDYFFFTFVSECTSQNDTILPQTDSCVVHPTLMCNGIANCPDCSDELEENCMNLNCQGSEWYFVVKCQQNSRGVSLLLFFRRFYALWR